GYERWWEGRKLWGGIVNQSRNLVIAALAHGPEELAWRDRFVHLVAAFAHASRMSLRSEREGPELVRLLGSDARAILDSNNRAVAVARQIAGMLEEARRRGGLDGFAFLSTDRERAGLVDHHGGCERILKTPLPIVYAIKLRRFIVLYLFALPF